MIPEIGLMIAAYVIARSLDMILYQIRHFDRGLKGILSVIVVVACVIAFATAIIMGTALVQGAADANIPHIQP